LCSTPTGVGYQSDETGPEYAGARDGREVEASEGDRLNQITEAQTPPELGPSAFDPTVTLSASVMVWRSFPSGWSTLTEVCGIRQPVVHPGATGPTPKFNIFM